MGPVYRPPSTHVGVTTPHSTSTRLTTAPSGTPTSTTPPPARPRRRRAGRPESPASSCPAANPKVDGERARLLAPGRSALLRAAAAWRTVARPVYAAAGLVAVTW